MILPIIFTALITLGLGLPLILLICPRINRVSLVGFSFPIGIGVFTLVVFVTNILGIRFSLLNESIILFILSAPLMLITNNKLKKFSVDFGQSIKNAKFTSVEKMILGVVVFLVVSSFVNTLYWPVHLWDSMVLYDFRAHVFASTGFMKGAFIDSYYYSYPLLTSLAHSIIYLAGGKYPQFIYSLFYLSLGLSFYGLLREFVSRKMTLLFTLILLISHPLFYHSLISYTNLPFTFYISLGSIGIYLWDKKKDIGYLTLSALLVGLSTWTRSVEPFWLAILLVVIVISIYRKKIWHVGVFSLLFLLIYEIWKIYQKSLSSVRVYTAGQVDGYTKILPALFDINRWGQIFVYFCKHVITPWGAVFLAFLIATILLIFIKNRKSLFLIFFITFALLAIFTAGIFVFSIYLDYWFGIGDAAERLSMFFYPLFIYCIALVINNITRVKI